MGQRMTTIGSLFTGYGGLDMAVADHFNAKVAWHSEIEPAACHVLEQNHPDVPNLGDVTTINWSNIQPVDILTAGYPCQPFSHAGNRKGQGDERHLWPYVAAAIDALRPRVVILENVRGHLTLGFGDVLADLSRVGYDAKWGVVRASDVGAPHARARLFIVAYPDPCGRCQDVCQPGDISAKANERQSGVADRYRSDGVASTGLPASDAYESGCETRIHAGHECPRLRSQSLGPATSASDARSERHGSEQGPGMVGGMGTQAEGSGRQASTTRTQPDTGSAIDWGKYGPAIDRWTLLLGRPAPTPTIPGNNGKPRLAPAFVEWMMGLPQGWVTGHGLIPSQELKMLGNGVVPQQAALALKLLVP